MAIEVQLDKITKLSEAVANDANFAKKAWSRMVKIDARSRNEMKNLIGGEGSGKCICEKQDLRKGNGDTVTYTTTARMKGRGRMGEQSLKDHTNKFNYGTWQVKIGLRRFAISYHRLLDLLRHRSDDKTAEQLEQELSADWWAGMEEDDIQHVLKRIGKLQSSGKNIFRVGGHSSTDDIAITDTFHTGIIEEAQAKMLGQGATPLMLEQEPHTSGVIPQYVVFLPWQAATGLESDPKFREVVTRAGERGGRNSYFTGGMPTWSNMLVHRHNVILNDGADGRQGSPLLPIAYLGKEITGAAELIITGGGSYNTDGSQTDVALNDYFANFPGYFWETYEGEAAPTDTNTYYAIIYNPDGTYEGISYNAAAIDGNTIDGDGAGTVTREVATIIDPVGTAEEQARFSHDHPSGAMIIPCTKNGVPIAYGLVMGADALAMAKGAVDAERIYDDDDFGINKGAGIMGIRGYNSPQDTIGNYRNFSLIEMAVNLPGVDIVTA